LDSKRRRTSADTHAHSNSDCNIDRHAHSNFNSDCNTDRHAHSNSN
jgi:hypothetical protein